MAIYHLSQGHVSRSSGRSSVQSAAYITGSCLYESRRELRADYSRRHSDIVAALTIAPKHVKGDLTTLLVWDKLEQFEDIYGKARFKTPETQEQYLSSACTAMTIVMAIPRELTEQNCIKLVDEFARSRFVSRGLVVTYAVHSNEGNPHAHLQISRRSIDEAGNFSWTKDRQICTPSFLHGTRKLWADLANNYLALEDHEARITHKSFTDLGIDLKPQKHRDWYADKLVAMGRESRQAAANKAIFKENRNRILADPSILLKELTHTKATFSELDLMHLVQKRVGDAAEIGSKVFETALSSAIVAGEGLSGEIRYTSATYKQKEGESLGMAREVSVKLYRQKLDAEQVKNLLNTQYSYLASAQKDAVLGLTTDARLAVLVGRAGAGKTTSLSAVADVYKQSGHKVIGMSLAALAAENLGNETGIESKTIHSWLYSWQRYEQAQTKFLSFNSIVTEGVLKQLDWYKDLNQFEGSQLTSKHVVVVDEAGMVGTNTWKELLGFVQRSGAKLIAVGDDNQFKAIEAGDFFRELKDIAKSKGNLHELSEIRRQSHEWMKDASNKLANLEIQEALSMYEHRGHIHALSPAEITQTIAKDYVQRVSQGQQGLVLAFTNAECKELNQTIREELHKCSKLDLNQSFTINDQNFTLKDTIVFLENDKWYVEIKDDAGNLKPEEFIKNGTRGEIIGAKALKYEDDIAYRLSVKLQSGAIATFNTSDYSNFTHGYAVTTHKAQGQTLGFALVKASKYMQAQGIYVAMTRHRDDMQLFYNTEEFKSFKELATSVCRYDAKDLVKDYTILPTNEAAFQRVQEYKLAGLDIVATLKEKNIDWNAYQELKKQRIELGKEILKDFKYHQLYVQQAGLTQEMLQIACGLKARPLTAAETKAYNTVLEYAEQSLAARKVWNEIKDTDPFYVKHHARYTEFDALRNKRDELAVVIQNNYSLHKEFVNENHGTYGINAKSIEAQAVKFKEDQKSSKKVLEPKQNYYSPTPKYQTDKAEIALIKQELNSRIKELAHEFYGKPSKQTSTEWRYGSKCALSIKVAGIHQGFFTNFETGEKGNSLNLIADKLGCDYKNAFKWGVEWLGHDRYLAKDYQQKQYQQHTEKAVEKEWQPVFPASEDKFSLYQPQLKYMMRGHKRTETYAYKDAEDNILGYVVRLEDKQGNKITPTLTWCQNRTTKELQWRWQGFGNDRPLYGLEQLRVKPHAPVLVVEGEKTADAARQIFKDHAVVTWSGGCGSVSKTDWSPLSGKDVTIFPDNDQAGKNAAVKISDILKQYAVDAKVIELPSTLPHKWDLADRVPDGVNVKALVQQPQKTEKVYTPEVQAVNAQEQLLKQQADLLLNQALKTLDYDDKKELLKGLPQDSQGVINKCQAALDFHKRYTDQQEIVEFKYLCQKHQPDLGLSERQTIERRLSELATNQRNNPDLLKAISSMDDKHMQKVAQNAVNPELEATKLQNQIQEQVKTRERYRGIEM